MKRTAWHFGLLMAGSMAAAGAGGAPANEPMLTTHDLLGDARFKAAYVAALGPRAKLPWLVKMSNSAPVRKLTLEGVEYQLAGPCKPHDCADNNLLLLYAPTRGAVYGHLFEKGKTTVIGTPGPALQAELGRQWKKEFRQQ